MWDSVRLQFSLSHTCPQPVTLLVSRLVFTGSIPVLHTNLWFQKHLKPTSLFSAQLRSIPLRLLRAIITELCAIKFTWAQVKSICALRINFYPILTICSGFNGPRYVLYFCGSKESAILSPQNLYKVWAIFCIYYVTN